MKLLNVEFFKSEFELVHWVNDHKVDVVSITQSRDSYRIFAVFYYKEGFNVEK